MPRPKLPDHERRRHRVTLYVTDAERDDLHNRAIPVGNAQRFLRELLGWATKPQARYCEYCGAERTKDEKHHCWGHDREIDDEMAKHEVGT